MKTLDELTNENPDVRASIERDFSVTDAMLHKALLQHDDNKDRGCANLLPKNKPAGSISNAVRDEVVFEQEYHGEFTDVNDSDDDEDEDHGTDYALDPVHIDGYED